MKVFKAKELFWCYFGKVVIPRNISDVVLVLVSVCACLGSCAGDLVLVCFTSSALPRLAESGEDHVWACLQAHHHPPAAAPPSHKHHAQIWHRHGVTQAFHHVLQSFLRLKQKQTLAKEWGSEKEKLVASESVWLVHNASHRLWQERGIGRHDLKMVSWSRSCHKDIESTYTGWSFATISCWQSSEIKTNN